LTRPLFHPESWARVRAALRARNRPVLVALDLDGTIAPIAPLPKLARVPAATLRSIARAARAGGVRVVVLSARRVSDMRRLIPVRNVLLVGQYGLEGPLAPPRRVLARLRRACGRVTRALIPRVRPVRGALLEPKGLTVAVHNRNVSGALARRKLREGVRSVASNQASRAGLVPTPGRRVVDFVPRGRDKGVALRALRARLRPRVRTVFYFGDSEGDEPAFRALGRGDFPVRVGRGATRARYRVADLRSVTRFLDAVAAHRADSA
jgi:trehalose 6-phosphate phosphatase